MARPGAPHANVAAPQDCATLIYLLHRSHHYKAERITMRLIVAGESGFVANNMFATR
jgi:hypothetical protein